jgi:hypothetical protein
MKRIFVIGINLALFVILQVVLMVSLYGMGYATDNAAPHNEWEIFMAFFIGHLCLNMLLLYLFKPVKTNFILISYAELILLYGVTFWHYYG